MAVHSYCDQQAGLLTVPLMSAIVSLVRRARVMLLSLMSLSLMYGILSMVMMVLWASEGAMMVSWVGPMSLVNVLAWSALVLALILEDVVQIVGSAVETSWVDVVDEIVVVD